jgi:hypothetical protein
VRRRRVRSPRDLGGNWRQRAHIKGWWESGGKSQRTLARQVVGWNPGAASSGEEIRTDMGVNQEEEEGGGLMTRVCDGVVGG